jgi:S-formylglutathione hydrolase FrmB
MTYARCLTAILTTIAALTAIAAAVPAPAAAWPPCEVRSQPVRTGITEVDRSRAGRVLTVELRSRAMGDVERVDVLLPEGYRSGGRFPVIYLLHGAAGSYRDWIDHGAAEIVGDLPAIVVMPDGGADGAYSDWFAAPPGSAEPFPAYETYYLDELMPWVQSALRSRRGPSNTAIAGLSMGGHGAMKLAAEHPGTFGFAGSFSGAVNPSLPLYQSLIQECKWGDPATDEVVWRDNDPTETPANLRGVDLFIRSGDGTPGPHDPGGGGIDLVESVVKMMNDAFLSALAGAGIDGVDAEFGPGTHTWPYWEDDLGEFVTWIEPKLGDPVRRPHRMSVESAHEEVDAWGWRFATHRDAREFLYVSTVGKRRLRLTGSGRVGVVSPPLYRPDRRYLLRRQGDRRRIRADHRGRLRFRVGLGPSHTEQQTEFGEAATADWRSASFRIAAER